MKFENTQVMNFGNALRGMRNPMNGWDKSDSYFGLINIENNTEKDYDITDNWMRKKYPFSSGDTPYVKMPEEWDKINKWLLKNGILQSDDENYPEIVEAAFIGPDDMRVAQKLIKAGPEHRKFMRQIFVSVDITAPLYWWKEMDKYQIGTTTNSASTMHKIASTPITLNCFEIDDYDRDAANMGEGTTHNCRSFYETLVISHLEMLRQKYNETKDVRYWKELIRWLPEGWLQKRTVTMNYENLLAICRQRRNHKLNEWSGKHTPVDQSFIQWARTLPYSSHLIFIDEQCEQEL